MFYPELWADQLYDGTGAHHAGVFPPLAINNVLTETYAMETALRPGCLRLMPAPDTTDLGLIWMAPLTVTEAGPFQREIIAALVAELDAGKAVVVHAPTVATVNAISGVVWLFVGGGHA